MFEYISQEERQKSRTNMWDIKKSVMNQNTHEKKSQIWGKLCEFYAGSLGPKVSSSQQQQKE